MLKESLRVGIYCQSICLCSKQDSPINGFISLLSASIVVPISNPFFAIIRRHPALKLKIMVDFGNFSEMISQQAICECFALCSFVPHLALDYLVCTVSHRANRSGLIKNYQEFLKLCKIPRTMKSLFRFPVTYCEVP